MKKYAPIFAVLLFSVLIFSIFTDMISFTKPRKIKINLIFQSCDPSHMCETDWIGELLSEFEVHQIYDPNYEVFENNSIVVVSEPEPEKINAYLDAFHEKHYNFGVIHLSDELYNSKTDFYSKCPFVLRNYWHKKFVAQKNVSFFPLGYKGEWRNLPEKQIKDAHHRQYMWSFAGQVKKSTRISMIANMKKIPNYFFYEIYSFNSPDAIKPEQYRDILLDSTFTPCPRGWWNLDSFRVCEALECGSIPIVEKTPFDYFQRCFGHYPFLAVESWDEVPELMNQLKADPIRLEKLRVECWQWWQTYKQNMKSQIMNMISENFELTPSQE